MNVSSWDETTRSVHMLLAARPLHVFQATPTITGKPGPPCLAMQGGHIFILRLRRGVGSTSGPPGARSHETIRGLGHWRSRWLRWSSAPSPPDRCACSVDLLLLIAV